jgi:hypothetical protein
MRERAGRHADGSLEQRGAQRALLQPQNHRRWITNAAEDAGNVRPPRRAPTTPYHGDGHADFRQRKPKNEDDAQRQIEDVHHAAMNMGAFMLPAPRMLPLMMC